MKKREFMKSLKDMDSKKIEENILELKRELLNLRFQKSTSKIENPMRLHVAKKDIARMKTVLREREIAELKKV